VNFARGPVRDMGVALLLSQGVSAESMSVPQQAKTLRDRATLAVSVRPKSVEERFSDLAASWRQGRGPYSVMRQLAVHPAYQQIIGLGTEAVPCILVEMERAPDWWFWALTSITGVDPVDPLHNGKLRLMAGDWFRWARANGISW